MPKYCVESVGFFARACVCLCVTYLHENTHKYVYIRKIILTTFIYLFFETYACSISSHPLLDCQNNTGQNIDL